MKLGIKSINDKGNVQKERLVLTVNSDADAGDYVVFQTAIEDGELTTDVQHTFWFPYYPVVEGDLIVLYTKSGSESTKKINGVNTAHFFYWGLTSCVWDDSTRVPVLLNAPEWVTKVPDDTEDGDKL